LPRKHYRIELGSFPTSVPDTFPAFRVYSLRAANSAEIHLARQQIDREADIVVGDSENAMPVPDHQRSSHEAVAIDTPISKNPAPLLNIVRSTGADGIKRVSRTVDLTQVPAVPWAWVDEHVYAAIRGCSVKVLQNERRLNIGCPFRRINGTTIRYKMGDIAAFLDAQPGGGGSVKPIGPPVRAPGRPRKSTT
jgi:hypothetical protein